MDIIVLRDSAVDASQYKRNNKVQSVGDYHAMQMINAGVAVAINPITEGEIVEEKIEEIKPEVKPIVKKVNRRK